MQNNPHDLLFPDIEIEKTLKKSSGGCVYLVRSTLTKTRYIYRIFTGSGEVYQRMTDISCPHLPRIYKVKQVEKSVHVLEEYIAGDPLSYIIQTQSLDEAQVKSIVLDLCAALEQLHLIGAVHRDIKPDNVIIRGSEAVLIDFDAARTVKNSRTSDTTILGTTGYAAPEQYGFTQTDARADIYSLGILINELLTRKHPSQMLSEGSFLPIISKCIEVNADRRYQNTGELSHAIKNMGVKNKKAPAKRLIAITAALFCILLLSAAALLAGMLSGKQADPSEISASESAKPALQSSSPPPASSPSVKTPSNDNTFKPTPTPTVEIKTAAPSKPMIANPNHPEAQFNEFYFDSDNDGMNEKYIFGAAFANILEETPILSEAIAVDENIYPEREVYPAVFACNPDNTYTYSSDLTAHLINRKTSIRKFGDNTAFPYNLYDDPQHPEKLGVIFSDSDIGRWVFEVSAELEDKKLSASSITDIYLMTEDIENTITLYREKTQKTISDYISHFTETEYFDVILGQNRIADFDVFMSDTKFAYAEKTPDGRLMITPLNGGENKFIIKAGDISQEFTCYVDLKKLSLMGSVYPDPIYQDFGTLHEDAEFEVRLDGERVNDFTVSCNREDICTVKRTDDGMLLISPVSPGTAKLTIKAENVTATIYIGIGK
ncbi:MAG: serine/threonine protein kinase [Clostridiales bacterium]|nr:serine/threonine protein kinase [Clostridiales bacterium]